LRRIERGATHGSAAAGPRKIRNSLIAETCEKQNVLRGQLTIHADRGPSMKSKPVALLMADLGVTKSHSR
jgi:putative transposase